MPADDIKSAAASSRRHFACDGCGTILGLPLSTTSTFVSLAGVFPTFLKPCTVPRGFLTISSAVTRPGSCLQPEVRQSLYQVALRSGVAEKAFRWERDEAIVLIPKTAGRGGAVLIRACD
jgi:hypothetical protein